MVSELPTSLIGIGETQGSEKIPHINYEGMRRVDPENLM